MSYVRSNVKRDPVLRLSNRLVLKSIIEQFEERSNVEPVHAKRPVKEKSAEIMQFDARQTDGCKLQISDCGTNSYKTILGTVVYYLTSCFYAKHVGFMLFVIFAAIVAPKLVTDLVLYPFSRLLFGTLYPAYASYKAVRTKNVKEYVKWMMYWIVFALFTCAETFTDVFLSWFPFYYEIKIILVFWLLSPATKGSSILYRKFVHPALCRREQEIDECIAKAKEQGYHTVLNLGTKGVNYATNVIMQTAIRGGGGLVQQLRKSYSLSDLTASDDHSDGHQDESDCSIDEPRVIRRSQTKSKGPRATSSPRVDMIFPEVDVNSRSVGRSDSINLGHIRSSEDISTYIPDNSNGQDLLTRTSSVGSSRTRSKVTRNTFTSIKRPGAAEDNGMIIEEVDDDLYPSENPYVDSQIANLEESIIVPYLMNMPMLDELNNERNIDTIYQRYLQLKLLFDSANIARDSRLERIEDRIVEVVDSTPNEPEVFEEVFESPVIDVPEPEKPPIETKIDECTVEAIDNNLNSKDISSEVISSDDSENEFNTPEGSPVLSAKLKHKKRPAPPPPIIVTDVKEADKVDLVTELKVEAVETKKPELEAFKIDTEPVQNIPQSVEVISQSVEAEPSDKKSKKSGKDKAMAKLMSIPSKLAFWKSDEALNEKFEKLSSSSSNCGDSDPMARINEDFNRISASLRSLDQFSDTSDKSVKTEEAAVQYIPLVLHTESKSTDV